MTLFIIVNIVLTIHVKTFRQCFDPLLSVLFLLDSGNIRIDGLFMDILFGLFLLITVLLLLKLH